jgi:hypothetical protein
MSKVIVVRGGSNPPADFNIHMNLLLWTSEFLKAALKKEWTQAEPRVIDLADEDPDIFKVYATFLYKQKFANKLFVKDRPKTADWTTLTKSYVLGEKLLDAEFEDFITEMVAQAKWCDEDLLETAGASNIHTMYEGTPLASKGRMLFAELVADYASPQRFAENKHSYPTEFVFDVAFIHNNRSSQIKTIPTRQLSIPRA